MSYSDNAQRQRLLLIAAAMTFLSLFAMIVGAAAQGSRRACPPGYDRTKQGCVKEKAKAKRLAAACGANEVRKGRSCVCAGDYTRKDGRCVAKTVEKLCGAYEVKRNGKCVCERGYERKGDKDKAIELIKKCIGLDPKYAYFKGQLKRIEAGDPKVDVVE